MKHLISIRDRAGFTLMELMVSSALIVAIMGLMLATVDQTRRTIKGTTSRVSQFQSARTAFEAMTRNLSQATLRTYWDLDRDANKEPVRYGRQSDLHFISGRAGGTTSMIFPGVAGAPALDEAVYPGHAIFFQAPVGNTAAETTATTGPTGTPAQLRYRALNNMLSVVGYYVKWDVDKSMPEFITKDTTLAKDRYRYRLMEVVQPGETTMVYNNINYTTMDAGVSPTFATPKSPYTKATDWIQVATGRLALPTDIQAFVPGTGPKDKVDYSRPLAENIVSLVIVPKRAEADRKDKDTLNELTKTFEYDSRPEKAFQAQARESKNPPDLKQLLGDKYVQAHQLPPIVQISMVAIDEDSAIKLEDWARKDNDNKPPKLTNGLFRSLTTQANLFKELGDPQRLDTRSLLYRVANPEGTLETPKLNYRLFTTDVVMRGAKWTNAEN